MVRFNLLDHQFSDGMKITISATLSAIRATGMQGTWKPYTREYRVTVPLTSVLGYGHNGVGFTPITRRQAIAKAEAMAYYTNDPQDAINTAQHMARQLAR